MTRPIQRRKIIRLTVSGELKARVPYGGLTYELIRARLCPRDKSAISATYRIIGVK